MDSKPSCNNSNDTSDAPPPSYIDSLSLPSSSHSNSNIYNHHITHQLASIPSLISSSLSHQQSLTTAHDEAILSALTTEIQTYLSDFASTGRTRGSLILVPKTDLTDVKESALPTDFDFRDDGAFDRLVRVPGGKWASGMAWYWKDEDMAQRLAGYLRVEPPKQILSKGTELPPRREEEERGIWGWKKTSRSASQVVKPVKSEQRSEKRDVGITGQESGDRVVMDVKAEEILFRTENDFGLLETERGWGIVVKLRVHLGGR